MQKKKKILIHSNSSLLRTGFGKHVRTLLTQLHKDGYEVAELTGSPFTWDAPELKRLPWKAWGGLPLPEEIDPSWDELQRALVGAGHFNLDRAIKEFKPDVYIAMDDCWNLLGIPHRPWFNKITSIIWTPVDSLPLHQVLLEMAPVVKNLWVKASFAEEELKKLGHEHVKTVPALIENKLFHPLKEEDRKNFRSSVGFDDDTFVIGFVFRNQLRKLVGSLMDAFKIFKDNNPGVKAKLLLHTYFGEQMGWNIPKLAKEIGIDMSDILTTYICRQCAAVRICNFQDLEIDCYACNTAKALINTNSAIGVTDSDLNTIYNLMDVKAQVISSGGFEMCQLEACYAGVPLMTVDYASGKNFTRNSDVFPIEFDFYREVNSHFKKSQPRPESIAKGLQHFYDMGREGRKEVGQKLRKWALDEFSEERWIKFFEDFIESQPPTDYDFEFDALANDKYEFNENLEPKEFVQDLYKGFFLTEIDPNNDEFKNLVNAINNGAASKRQIYDTFVSKALENNARHTKPKLEDLVKDTGNKKLLYVMPASAGDGLISLAVLTRLFELYPGWDIYVATDPKYFGIYSHLPLGGLLKYEPYMDSFKATEGVGGRAGAFDVVLQPYLVSQKFPCFIHNGKDINELQVA